VLKQMASDVNGNGRWLCECACGTRRALLGRGLRAGSTRSCGACRRKRDLTGTDFGLWTVLERADTATGHRDSWLVRCKCGTERVIQGSRLERDGTAGCGCRISEMNALAFTKDMKGQTVGRWTVLAQAPSRGKRRRVRWWCRCVCGVVRDVLAGNLSRGLSMSCGQCQERWSASCG
jgi:hypothetical protein